MNLNQATQNNRQLQPKSRVLVLGLDGGTFDVIKPLIKAGKLPNLARLMKGGAFGVLRSTYPPITPSAWLSFAIGKNPGKHGIYDFQKVNTNSYEFYPIPAGQHGQKTIWKLVSDQGGKVVVLDVPFTYPPEEVNGAIITGYGTPEVAGVQFTSPPGLRQELVEKCGSCELGYPVGIKYSVQEDFFKLWDEVIESRRCISTYLMDKVDWDFYMIVYGITDNLSHATWPYLEPQHPAYHEENSAKYRQKLFDYYERIDQEMGQLLARCDERTTVIVMSDHGFGSTPTPKYLTKLLLDAGLLRYKSNPVSNTLMRIALNAYYKVPFLSRFTRSLSGQRRMGLKKALTKTAIFPTQKMIDWEKTKAFPGGYGLQVYINTKGKYPQGTVAPGAEYEALQEQIAEKLLAFRDPINGQPIIKAVYKAQDIYSGPQFESAPDLIVEYNNVYSPGQTEYKGKLNNSLEGNHVMEGILIAQGPDIVPGALPTQNIIDLAPTILHLMGQPVPSDMDGRVITEMINPTCMANTPIQYGGPAVTSQVSEEGYSEEEAEQVREQLRALGYID
jgi:predicted AlkP superfamily phosphohydrolase/phosphomutase